MIASVIVFGELALGIASAAKFTAPNHEGVIEHAALFQVLDEGGAGLIGFAGLVSNAGGQIAMMIPALVVELDKAHSAFGQAASEQTIGGKTSRFAAIGTIQLERALRLFGKVGDFRHAGLHPVSHFILGDARFNFRIQLALELKFVQGVEFIEQRAPA